MEFNDFLDEGEADPQPLGLSKGFCFFLEMASEYFLQGSVRDANPRIGDASEHEFRIVFKTYVDSPTGAVIFDGVSQKIIEELVELFLNPGNLDRFWGKRSFHFDLMFLAQGFDGQA